MKRKKMPLMVKYAIAALGLTWSLSGLTAAAYPIKDLSLYEKVYLNGVLSQKPVTIIDIDKANNRVKIMGEDGFGKWVPASRVKSKVEKTKERGGQIVGTALITQCVFQYENCDSAKLGEMIYNKEYKFGDPFPAKGGGFAVKKGQRAAPVTKRPDFAPAPRPTIPTPRPAPSITSTKPTVESSLNGARSQIFIGNRCDEAVTILDLAIKTPNVTRRPTRFEKFTVQPGERRLISVNSHTEFDDATELYMVASSASHAWQSDKQTAMDGWVNRYMLMNVLPEKAGVRSTSFTCPK